MGEIIGVLDKLYSEQYTCVLSAKYPALKTSQQFNSLNYHDRPYC